MNNIQELKKILYLGPKGSYSDIAKQLFTDYYSKTCKFCEINSIGQIINLLMQDNSELIGAVLPIENSVEGIVRETQDKLNLLVEHGFYIYSEARLLISHSLIGYAEDFNDIKIVTSHPQALAQCREYLNKTFGDTLVLEPAFSTSKSIELLSKNNPEKVAIGNEYCASLHNIPILDSDINDEKNNTTRFILVSKMIPPRTDCNKISVVFSTENKSGALNRALTVLENYGLNLSYIDSRPSRKELGEYIFYADFAGHIEDNNISLALIELQSQVKTLNILSKGSIVIN